MGKILVTTARKTTDCSINMAKTAAIILGCQYIERHQESVEMLREITGAESVLVVKKKQYILNTPQGELFFHPSMAHLRIKNLRLGMKDNMAEAMKLEKGMSVIDCTMGMGADAIVESYIVGEKGKVTAIEASQVIAFIIKYGMSNLIAENYDIHEAMRRVEIFNCDYIDFLKRQPDNSADIVYFDPMFRHPIEKSSSLRPLRLLADNRALSVEAVSEAKRVAKKRVVMKENSHSGEFSRLGFNVFYGGKYSHVRYGVIELSE